MKNIIREKRERREKIKDAINKYILVALLLASFFLLLYMLNISYEEKKMIEMFSNTTSNLNLNSNIELNDLQIHKNYMKGYDNKLFKPNDFITKDELAFAIANLSSDYNSSTKYDDTFEDAFECDNLNEIGYCIEAGVFKLVDSKFLPKSYITRSELLNALMKLKKHEELIFSYDYSKGKASWYEQYINLIDNIEDDSKGKDNEIVQSYVTRAITCSIINQIYDRSLALNSEIKQKLENIETFNDVSINDWYYADIFEATYAHEISELHYLNANDIEIDLTYPNSAYIDFKCVYQYPELPTGCEITALAQLLNHYSFDIDKVTLSNKYLSKKNYGGSDFVNEFVGDPRTNEGFGCFAEAIKLAGNRYFEEKNVNFEVINLSGITMNEVYYLVSQGYPVNVWVTSNMVASYKTLLWVYDDKMIYWHVNEHCVTLIGYDKDLSIVYVSDPLAGITSYDMSIFEHRFEELGNQALIVKAKNIDLGIQERPIEISNIIFSNGISQILSGKTYELKVVVDPAYAQSENLEWSSSDENVISVSHGLISANSIGKAIVSAESNNGVKASIEIEVR